MYHTVLNCSNLPWNSLQLYHQVEASTLERLFVKSQLRIKMENEEEVGWESRSHLIANSRALSHNTLRFNSHREHWVVNFEYLQNLISWETLRVKSHLIMYCMRAEESWWKSGSHLLSSSTRALQPWEMASKSPKCHCCPTLDSRTLIFQSSTNTNPLANSGPSSPQFLGHYTTWIRWNTEQKFGI